MNRAVDGDVQQDVRAEGATGTVTPDPAVSQLPMEGAPAPEQAPRQLVVGNVPSEPAGYRPRSEMLAELDRAEARVSVIHPADGRHGTGASQLAAAYARAKLEAGWRLVAWVNAANTSNLQAGLAAVADAAGLSDEDSRLGGTEVPAAVRHWLETDGDRCLLVFDDVSDPEALTACVPAHGQARVLITSTWPPPASLGGSVAVSVFSAAEASRFLAAQTGLREEEAAAAVAAELGHLPLALALAAPLIAGRPRGYEWYLDRLQVASADVPLAADDGEPYLPGLAEAVRLALQAVPAADRTGVCSRVLEIMSVLSPGGVHREMLYAAGQAGVLASGRHRIPKGSLDQVLEWLGHRSLLAVSLDGQTVSLPPLLARVIRNGLHRRQRLAAVGEAAAFVLDVYSRALLESADRRAVRQIPQQVSALLSCLAGSAADVNEDQAWLLLKLRFVAFYHLVELGDSAPQAIAIGEPLAEDLDRLLGPDHPDTLNSQNSLAAAYLAAGRVADAIPLFEHALAARQRSLGPDDPETLTSQNNLASAYQDAGQTAEAIRLYELNLEARERLLGPDHPSTVNSRANLAAAYRDAGRSAEAIPLLEQALAVRERTLGSGHPDTQVSRRNLARAYQDTGRDVEAAPLLDRVLADRKRIPRSDRGAPAPQDDVTAAGPPAAAVTENIPAARPAAAIPGSQPPPGAGQRAGGFRRPPASPAKRLLPAGFRRPPADSARRRLPPSAASSAARPDDRSDSRPSPQPDELRRAQEIAAAIAVRNPSGVVRAYDEYAAHLYGYSHWMLRDSAAAAKALTDTFVAAVGMLNEPPAPHELRAWLFALARTECRRRITPLPAGRDEEAAAVGRLSSPPAGAPDPMASPGAAGSSSEATSQVSDETISFSAVGSASEVAAAQDGPPASKVRNEPPDATTSFRAVGQPPGPGPEPSDATISFGAIGRSPDVIRELPDATVSFRVIGQPIDATVPFQVITATAQPAADTGGDELRSLIYSVLAGLRSREREVIELSFRHDLSDDELAITLGVSQSRARTLAARARKRLEQALRALHVVLTRRDACPVLGTLLTDWDGQLTEQTRDLVTWHIEECPACTQHRWGALRPAAFSRLLPLAPLPPELREQTIGACTSTAEAAVAYRRKVARRARSRQLARFSYARRQVSWASIRAHPGISIAAAAVVLWACTAVSVLLVAISGSQSGSTLAATRAGDAHAVKASATPASRASPSLSPSAAPRTASAPASAVAAPSPVVSKAPVYSPYPLHRSSSPQASKSVRASHSPTPAPSKSPSASPSASSPSPSVSASASSTATP